MQITNFKNSNLIATKEYLLISSCNTIIAFRERSSDDWCKCMDSYSNTSSKHFFELTGLKFKDIKKIDEKDFNNIIGNI